VEHKSRIYKENIILLLIIIVALYYSVKYISSFFDNTTLKLPNVDINLSVVQIDTDILIKNYIKKDIQNNIKNIDTTKQIEHNQTINKVINYKQNIKPYTTNHINDINKIDDKNITKKQIKIEPKKVIKPKPTIKPVKKQNKELMLSVLRKYIKSTIIEIRDNAKKLPNSIDGDIKIRVTVLKNGTYKNITYLKGDKRLLKQVKIAIKQSSVKEIDDIIKAQFPRYIRFKIQFSNNGKI
jgi:hypothetical protein